MALTDPACPACGSTAVVYSKAKLYAGHTSQCRSCGETFDQDHAYGPPITTTTVPPAVSAIPGDLACPTCGASTVTVSAMVWVMADRNNEIDTEVGPGFSYGDESPAVCRSCGHRGRLIEFEACECDSAVVPGTMYDPALGNVERCDLCKKFPGDLEAAVAVSEKVGKPAWVLMEHPRDVFQIERVTAELCEPADGKVHWIASGTDPWIGDWREGIELAADDRPVWPTTADEAAYLKSPWERTEPEQELAEDFFAWADRNGVA